MGISIKNMGCHEQQCAYSGCECDITNGLDALDSSCWTFLWNGAGNRSQKKQIVCFRF